MIRDFPAPASFVDEVCVALSVLFAYVTAVAAARHSCALFMAAAAGHNRHGAGRELGSGGRSGQALAMSQFDPHEKTEAYGDFRHLRVAARMSPAEPTGRLPGWQSLRPLGAATP